MTKRTYSMVMIGIFGAIISVISIIPTGIYILGVPATLQTFAVTLVAYILGSKNGTKAVMIYILLGAMGLPLFGGFKGGIGVILSITGGFIIGFVPLSIMTGLTVKYKSRLKVAVVSFIGLIICYILGVSWFAFVSGNDFVTGVIAMAVPYLPKDILSIVAAYMVASRLKKSVKYIGME